MVRFLVFACFLVAVGYVLTTPEEPQLALGARADSAAASNAPAEKRLLRSWGPTLGALSRRHTAEERPGAAQTIQTASNPDFHKYGPKTELWVLGQSNGFKDPADPAAEDDGWTNDGFVETATLAAAQSAAEKRLAAMEPDPAAGSQAASSAAKRVANLVGLEPRQVHRKAKRAEPVVDRIAAARPPQRRGLFGWSGPKPRPAAARPASTSRTAQTVQRKRGLFAAFTGRSKPTQRAWALGPSSR